MKRIIPLCFAAASFAAFPAAAQTAPAPTPTASTAATVAAGATVYDSAGAVVGTIDSVDGTNAVVNTGTVKAAIATSSFGKGAKGPVLGLTKAQLEAQVGAQAAQAGADFKAKLVAGAAVYGTGGAQLGTIKSVAGDTITVTTPNGDAALPAAGFGPGPSGVTLGMTAAQLAAAMNAAAPSTPGTTPDASTAPPGANTATTPAATPTPAPSPSPTATPARSKRK